ncbi:MAG TPA: hypothetical protein VF519_06025 [Mycobacteriales bacterium]|jgi:hypothetical protein
MRLLRIACAAALGAALACARDAAPRPALPTFTPLPAVAADDLPWSLKEYFLNGGRAPHVEAAAVEEEVARCLRDAGFGYEPVRPENPTWFTTIGDLRRFRSTYGYGTVSLPPEGTGAKAAAEANAAYRARLAPEDQRRYDEALGVVDEALGSGVPAPGVPGCRARALRAVRGGLPRTDPAVLREVAAIDPSTDRRYAAAVTAWSACMRDQGYDFAHPDDPQREARAAKGEPAERLRAEVRLAVADVTCYVAHVHPVQAAVEREGLRAVVARHPAFGRFLPPT